MAPRWSGATRRRHRRWRSAGRSCANSSDGRLFERDDLAWYRGAWVEAFLFMYDTSFYDRAAGRYRIDEILDDGEREFGGYDFILLWQSYPRLGIDGRNQLDLYRDMPGGLPGLRDMVRRAQDRGVRVFVNYNPWDVGTRREPDGQGDGEGLASIIAAIGADGVFLDTMTMDEPGFREPLERANPSIVFNPEGIPPTSALSSVAGSWLQRRAVTPPGLLTIRWLQPRFSFRAIERTALDRSEVVQKGFFHGCGHVVWENVFGWWNPWSGGGPRPAAPLHVDSARARRRVPGHGLAALRRDPGRRRIRASLAGWADHGAHPVQRVRRAARRAAAARWGPRRRRRCPAPL